ncbi:unnamed protein product [Protopolystoma xenopodis]|uniref:Uncharacterized protein n=1 Tax=Protopolystoma xenopodis TaxID=117903 RepID=A0A3S5C8W1_9PLAT|nr:unnamed protein product [Protopolystoma xenopodis]
MAFSPGSTDPVSVGPTVIFTESPLEDPVNKPLDLTQPNDSCRKHVILSTDQLTTVKTGRTVGEEDRVCGEDGRGAKCKFALSDLPDRFASDLSAIPRLIPSDQVEVSGESRQGPIERDSDSRMTRTVEAQPTELSRADDTLRPLASPHHRYHRNHPHEYLHENQHHQTISQLVASETTNRPRNGNQEAGRQTGRNSGRVQKGREATGKGDYENLEEVFAELLLDKRRENNDTLRIIAAAVSHIRFTLNLVEPVFCRLLTMAYVGRKCFTHERLF